MWFSRGDVEELDHFWKMKQMQYLFPSIDWRPYKISTATAEAKYFVQFS
jgi:hypothetical protein